MTVGLKIRSITNEIGTVAFFNAFFSTIHANLEPGEWGKKFPIIMQDLYQGEISKNNAEQALQELNQISTELSQLTPDKIVWDFEDPKARPPWGDNISDDITDLSNYFVTSTGRDLIDTIRQCLELLIRKDGSIKVVNY